MGFHFLLQGIFLIQGSSLHLLCWQVNFYHCSVTQSCLTLCDPRDGSPPDSPVPGILPARTLEWVAISSSRGSPQPRDRSRISYMPPASAGGFNPLVMKIPWRRKWKPTPVFLSGKSHGLRSLVGCSPWGRKELDVTERLHFTSLLY